MTLSRHRVARRALLAAALLLPALSALTATAKAQAWPTRDITLIAPYAPGGSTDPIARQYANQLKKLLNVNVVVENKPGASGSIGNGAVVSATPDGYTIGLGSNSTLVYQGIIQKNLPYKTPDDYESIVKLADLPTVLAVKGDSPYKDFATFMEAVKASPGKIRASVSGLRTTPDLVIQQMNRRGNVRLATVPFTGGGGEALLAVLGGRVEAVAGFGPTLKGQADAGEIRVIAVFAKEPYPLFPNATPVAQAGYDAVMATNYYIFAPKGLPADVRTKLIEVSKQAVMQPEFTSSMTDLGYLLDPKTGDAMKAELTAMHQELLELNTFLTQK